MRILKISKAGVSKISAHPVTAKTGQKYFAVTHGEEGRGRWQIRLPLATREFPCAQAQVVKEIRRSEGETPSAILDCGHTQSISGPGWGHYTEGAQVECKTCNAPLALTGEYKLMDLHKQDPRGNPLFLLALGEQDGTQLVLWRLTGGFRGGATYSVSGQARVLATGYVAEGIAGRMGGEDAPLVLVEGPCALTWHRSGRLYGEPADWSAVWDGAAWTVAPVHECVLEEAALAY